jgi:hypothetical protein
MPTTIVSATIAQGQSLSSAVDCTTKNPTLIFVPPEWNGANLSFQLSPDNTVYSDVVDAAGNLLQVTCRAGTCRSVPDEANDFYAWIKLRSGVPQDQSCIFKLVIVS